MQSIIRTSKKVRSLLKKHFHISMICNVPASNVAFVLNAISKMTLNQLIPTSGPMICRGHSKTNEIFLDNELIVAKDKRCFGVL